jgi:hypothetical protein
VDLALVAMLVALVLAAIVVRRRPQDEAPILVLSVAAVAAAAVAVVTAPSNVVPGLLVAFPLAAAGLVLIRRTTVATTAARVSLVVFGLFSLAVVATQYQRGGSGEWGGRYFALGIPLVVPVLLVALRDGGRRLAPLARRTAALSLLGCLVALSAMAVGSLRAAHQRNAGMNAAVARASAATPAGDDGRPVVVAADGTLARQGWPTFDRARWLLAGPAPADLVARLRAAGIAQFVLVTRDPAGFGPGSGTSVVSRQDGGTAGVHWHVLVVSAA